MPIKIPTHVSRPSILSHTLCFVILFLVVSVHTDSGSKMVWAQYTCSEDSSTAPPEEPPEACFTPARGPHCERLRWGWGDCPGSPGKACDWCYDPRTGKIVAYVPRTNRTYKLYLSPVTRTGISVHDSTGKRLLLYGQGTGEGTGGRVFYNPEFWPNKKVCLSGMTSDVVLQHELLHAYRYAGGQIDFRPPDANDSFAGKQLTPGNFPTKEEIWTVEKENLYRAARTPPIRAREGYNTDC